nr:hypothetical protein [Tanacetum cinerariifolium]
KSDASLIPLHALNGVDAGCVAPVTLVIHAVTEDVAVDARQTDEVGFEIRTRFAVVVFVDQHGRVDRACACMLAEVDDRAQGMTFVEDVVDDQYIAVNERHFRLGFPEQLAAAGFVAITRRVQIRSFQREVQVRQQLAGENQATVHHAEDDRV